jgi:diguanylate cyclase (GGDEF)-like protein
MMVAQHKSAALRHLLRQAGATVLIVLLLLAAAVYLPRPVVDSMLRSDLEAQSAIWRDRIVSHLTLREGTFDAEQTTAEDEVFLTGVVQTSDIFRLRLIGANGRVFWASVPEEIGTFDAAAHHGHEIEHDGILVTTDDATARAYEAAPAGGAVRADEAHDGGERHDDEMIAEIDAPVQGRSGYGRIAMFVDLTQARMTNLKRVRLLICAMAVIAGAVGTVLVTSVILGNRRRMAEIRNRADEEKAILADQLRMAREVRLLGELNEWLQSSRSLDELFDMVARFLTHILPDCEGSIYVYSNSRDVLDGCASWNGGHHKPHIHPEECWGLRRGRTYVFGDGDIDFTCGHAEPHDGRSYLCIPVLAHGETVGLMHLRARAGKSVEDFREGRKLAQMCAEQISLAIANVRMRDQLQDQSIRDPLTGLYNRRHLTDSLRRALAARQRNGAELSVVAIDIDHFKRFNDNHGHDAGDMVLRAVGGTLSALCDRDDLACRIGGEELMVLLPETGAAAAMQRAEAMRAAVEAITVRYGEKALPRVTISLGVAVAPQHGTLPQDLMRIADDALYAAKGQGRNQVVLADLSARDRADETAAGASVTRIAAE